MAIFARGSHYALEDLGSLEYSIISLDWCMNPEVAREKAPGKTLQGNADPSILYGSPESIHAHVERMVKQFGTKKYIANLGHGMHPDHDPEHLRAYLEAIVIDAHFRRNLHLNKPSIDKVLFY